jgi:lactate dehydrogenase-like 2-hydroxyacid dehydrogenase
MAVHVYRPHRFLEDLDPGIERELKTLGVRFESRLHPRTEAVLTLLDVKIGAEFLDRAPKVRVVANVAVGYDNLDLAELTRRGVMATNTPEVLTEATADLAWALLLAAARRVPEGDRYVRAGRFRKWGFELLRGFDVHGKTLGIVGAGRIGQAVGHRSIGFSMEVLYTSRERKLLFERTVRAKRVDLRTLLRKSDFVSLHVPLSGETRRLLGAPELALLRPTAVLINTARGPLVDEAALARALKSGRLGAAGLDVYEHEPEIHPALLGLDNVVLLPHVGSATETARRRMYETALRNVMAALRGRVPPNCLNAAGLKLR